MIDDKGFPCSRCGEKTVLPLGRQVAIQLGSAFNPGIYQFNFKHPICNKCVKSFITWWQREKK